MSIISVLVAAVALGFAFHRFLLGGFSGSVSSFTRCVLAACHDVFFFFVFTQVPLRLCSAPVLPWCHGAQKDSPCLARVHRPL